MGEMQKTAVVYILDISLKKEKMWKAFFFCVVIVSEKTLMEYVDRF